MQIFNCLEWKHHFPWLDAIPLKWDYWISNVITFVPFTPLSSKFLSGKGRKIRAAIGVYSVETWKLFGINSKSWMNKWRNFAQCIADVKEMFQTNGIIEFMTIILYVFCAFVGRKFYLQILLLDSISSSSFIYLFIFVRSHSPHRILLYIFIWRKFAYFIFYWEKMFPIFLSPSIWFECKRSRLFIMDIDLRGGNGRVSIFHQNQTIWSKTIKMFTVIIYLTDFFSSRMRPFSTGFALKRIAKKNVSSKILLNLWYKKQNKWKGKTYANKKLRVGKEKNMVFY